MPRASRNSQAAMASAIIPDESLRTFYTYNPTITSQTSQLSQSTNNQAGNDDSMWSRRGSGRAAAAGHGSTAAGAGGLGASTSNLTDLSVSSASLNSPMHSSHAASEASSYATRAITGVVDPADEDQFEEDDDDDDDDDDDVVVVRSSTATANRRRRHNAPISEEDEEAYDMQGEGEGEEREYNEPSTTSMFSSRLLDESEEDEITNGSTGAGYNAHLHGDADSLADATPEEVEARAMEVLGWDTIGQDKELYDVDLERWKRISSKHQEAGTPEYQALHAIQAKLLTAVQELEHTEWMYPEPLPFSTYLPEPSSTIGHKSQTTLPFHDFNSGTGGGGGSNWSDIAFNPQSTFTPLAPSGQATYPDTYRVQKALGALTHSSSISSSTPATSTEGEIGGGSGTRMGGVGYHGNAIPIPKPDFSWLEAEVQTILGDQDKSFAAKAKFPWATALHDPSASPAAVEKGHSLTTDAVKDASMLRGSSMSLTREVGVIRLQ